MSTPITPDRFAKDHWSLLAYVETLCVDGKDGMGRIDKTRMRANPERHPLQALNEFAAPWKSAYSTRLAGYTGFAQRDDVAAATAAGVMAEGHDDWDCLDDLQAAGLVEIFSLSNGFVKLTKRGMQVVHQLREHKAQGGTFWNFQEPAAA